MVHKFIVIDEGSNIPYRIQVKEKKCDVCNKTFYFESGVASWCPHCQAFLLKYVCSITNEEKTTREAYDVNLCNFHSDMQCAYCPDVIQK